MYGNTFAAIASKQKTGVERFVSALVCSIYTSMPSADLEGL